MLILLLISSTINLLLILKVNNCNIAENSIKSKVNIDYNLDLILHNFEPTLPFPRIVFLWVELSVNSGQFDFCQIMMCRVKYSMALITQWLCSHCIVFCLLAS